MFDGINTKFEDAEIIINEDSADYAVTLIKNKLKACSNHSELYCYLSKAYIYKKDFQKAKDYAKKALELNPDYSYAQARYLSALQKNNEKEIFFALAEKFLKKNKFDIVSYALILMAFCNENYTGRMQRTVSNKIKKHLIKPGNVFEYTVLECLYYTNNNTNKLLQLAESFENNHYKDFQFFWFSAVYFENRNPKKALSFIDKAISLKPDNYNAYYKKGLILKQLEDYNSALEAFLCAEENGCRDLYLYAYIAALFIIGSNEKNALKYLNKALLLDNKYSWAHYKKAMIYYDNNLYDKAMKEFLLSEKDALPEWNIYARMSFCCYKNKTPQKELEYADKAVLFDRDKAFAHYRRGFCLFNLNRHEEALKSFKNAEKLHCRYNDYYEKTAQIYYEKGDYKKALKYLNKQILSNNFNPDLYRIKALIYEDIGNIKKAEQAYEKYLSSCKNDGY